MKSVSLFVLAIMSIVLLPVAGCISKPPPHSPAFPSDPIISLILFERGHWNYAPRMNISIWPDGRVEYFSDADLKKWVDWAPFEEANWVPVQLTKRLSVADLNHITHEICSICANIPDRLEYSTPNGADMTMVVVCGHCKYALRNSDIAYLVGKSMGNRPNRKGWDEFAVIWTKLYEQIEWAIDSGKPD